MKFLLGSVYDGLRNIKEIALITWDSILLCVDDALDCWGDDE